MTHEQREQYRFESAVQHWLAREFGVNDEQDILF